ncbi:hypothetical protein ACIBG7_24950 [Nonomuraea sp. NPDC050328]|uniref:YxiG-like protein n=1 Tax=Nonomuraea sp. NPDC050328 TaxID=3364361 RepID=UPI0037B873D8
MTALQAALDEIFDFALVHHGFTDYMRDYEAHIFIPATPTHEAPVRLRYRSTHCTQANVTTAAP